MREAFLRAACAAAAAVLFLAGCGDDGGDCDAGEAECISQSLVRSCVPGKGGNEWFVHSCGEEEVCSSRGGGASSADDAGASAPAGSGAACVGTCTAGAGECVSDVIARYCVDGRAWQINPCGAGQRCVDGACEFGDGGLQLCNPGARECGSEDIEKVCDRDGSKWLEQDCQDGEQCLVDRCAPDPDASCDVESRCLDNKTALRCLGEDRGFEVVECDGDNYCEDGRCRGTICAIGSVCAEDNQVVECLDGESLRTTQCAVNEACKQERDNAVCVPKTCEPGAIVCGDPLDDSVDTMQFFSQCRSGVETLSGLPEWVRGECTGLLQCDPGAALLGTPCQQECTPGAQTCLRDPVLGIADGWAECLDDGTWGPVTSCNTGGLREQCVIKRNLDASVLPEAICAEPVCAHVIDNQAGEGGSCNGAQIQPCSEDGELQDPVACEVGICRATLLETQADGRVPGACDQDVECEEGEERCLVDNLIPSTLYQICENGFWSARLSTCTDDGQCLDFVDASGLRKKVCGADCSPGEKRCNISDQVETCDDDGNWGSATSCDVGVCSTLGSDPGKRDAACVLECIPGEVQCTGASVSASDGVNTGFAQEAVCDADGLLGTPTDCAADTACRVSSTGTHGGCVECIGPDVLGGNQWGYMDTRCDPAAATQVQECQDDNSWAASRACNGATSCRMVNGSSCGTCSIDGVVMPCTESNLATEQICGQCTHANIGTLASCRDATIVSLTASTTVDTCETLFGDGTATEAAGQPTGTAEWGGWLDCCDGMAVGGADGEFLQNSTCTSRGYGTPVAAGGAPDCCSLWVSAGVGAAFAYCSP